MSQVYFLSGIDTDAGKSYCAGWLAREWARAGKNVITQKFIQTGNCEYSEDIELHRRIMGIPLQEADLDHTTAPLIYSYPCSPQLAARLDKRDIPLDVIEASTERLAAQYDVVIIEGAGGLMVPLTDEYLTIDYPADRKIPLILVVHGALGSINHALLSLEAVKRRGMELAYVLYNTCFDDDSLIAEDTFGFIGRYLAREFPETELIKVPRIFLPQQKN